MEEFFQKHVYQKWNIWAAASACLLLGTMLVIGATYTPGNGVTAEKFFVPLFALGIFITSLGIGCIVGVQASGKVDLMEPHTNRSFLGWCALGVAMGLWGFSTCLHPDLFDVTGLAPKYVVATQDVLTTLKGVAAVVGVGGVFVLKTLRKEA